MKFLVSTLFTVGTTASMIAGSGGPSGGSPAGCVVEGCPSPVEEWFEANAGMEAAAEAYYAAPLWDIDLRSPFAEVTPLGTIALTKRIARTVDSTVWEGTLPGGRTVIAKYTNDCSRRLRGMETDVFPIDEFVYMSVFNQTGITPNVYGLSEPAAVVRGSPKTNSMTMDAKEEKCIAIGAKVRLLVQARAGMEIAQYVAWLRVKYPDNKRFLRAILALGWKTVKLLQQLHVRGVIHDDVHWGNIMFKTPKASPEEYDLTKDKLVLVDLGYARYFPGEIGSADRVPIRQGANALLASLWNLNHWRTGRRDDLYRAMEMIAVILSDGAMDKGINKILAKERRFLHPLGLTGQQEDDLHRRVIRQCKADYPLFKPSAELESECCLKMGLSDRKRAKVQKSLESIMSAISIIPHPDTTPDYESIIKSLKMVAESL